MQTALYRLVVAALLLLVPVLALADPAFIYLVRHGEKQQTAKDPDPPLTSTGQARARNIAHLLHRAGINAVFSSQTARTLQTAQPMAQAAGVAVQTYDADNPATLAARLHAIDGGAVLVVGHSNTLPKLVRLLGGAAGSDIGDEEYDRVYQLSKDASGKVVTVLMSSQP